MSRHPVVSCALAALLSLLNACSSTRPTSPTAPAVAPPTAEDLNPLLEPIRERQHVPALAGAIVRGNDVIALGAVGVRKLGDPTPVTVDDLWHIGSDTKAMTATVIGILVEQGKLRWDMTPAEVFPELRDRMDPNYRTVTIEQLLWHRGGTPTDLRAGGLWQRLLKREGTPTEQRRTLVEGVLTQAPVASPMTKFVYSNAGYAIAGAMAEQVTGEAWETLTQRLLFDPLGMASAGFGAPGTAGAVDAPYGHANRLFVLQPVEPGPEADNPPAIAPAGTVHVSLRDWAKFVALHVRGAQDRLTPEQARVLSAATIRRLQTPPPGADYAPGWGVAERDWGGRVLTHAGSNTMWFALAWLAPEKDFAVLVTTNAGADTAAQACEQAAGALIQHCLNEN